MVFTLTEFARDACSDVSVALFSAGGVAGFRSCSSCFAPGMFLFVPVVKPSSHCSWIISNKNHVSNKG